MRIDRPILFANLRALHRGRLSPAQVESYEAILDAAAADGVEDPRQLAYILATTRGEVGSAMQPVREVGRGKGRAYGKPAPNGQTYYGRGFVQLTWQRNYRAMGDLLGIELVSSPDLALDRQIAAQILVKGMKRGMFTGKALSTYISGDRCDFLNARRIINGMDRASEFARFAANYLKAITAAGVTEQAPKGEVKQVAAGVTPTRTAFETVTPSHQESPVADAVPPFPEKQGRPLVKLIVGAVAALIAAAFGWVFMGGRP